MQPLVGRKGVIVKYRKKPVVIDAEQWWPGKAIEGIVRREAQPVPSRAGGIAFTMPPQDVIETLEGDMTVSPGDWIITGVKGERYPCKPDIFEATYEPAE
jgi:hypothetical protein